MNLTKIFQGYKNLIIFTAYYFSTLLLLATFFSPWKRYVWRKKQRGLHLGETLFIAASNITSRVIGMILRSVMVLIGICGVIGIIILGLPLSILISLIDPWSSIFKLQELLQTRTLAGDWHYGYTPTLDPFVTDLYEQPHPFPLVDREEEMNTLVQTLSQTSHPNLLLVGEPGAGRHALLIKAASLIVDNRFLVFDYIAFLKDKKEASEKEGALAEVLEEAASAGNVILIVPHFEEFIAFSNVVEQALTDNRLLLIGITNKSSYNSDLLPNSHLMKYLSVLEIEQLPKQYVYQTVTDRTTQQYKLPLPPKLMHELVDASYQLISLESKHQPEAAVKLLDEFISFYNQNKKHYQTDYENALHYFLEKRLKIPVGRISQTEKGKLRHLEYFLHQRVIAQNEAISEISRALKRRRLELSDTNKPIGTFLFLGPTGVGKTETAKALAAIFFDPPAGGEKKLLRFDMSRFQDTSPVNQLIDEMAALIRSNPYGVLLLDEFEKASSTIRNLFLTILDEGYFTDSHGLTVLCNNLIIIATSNAGSEFIREHITENFQQLLIDHILKNNLFSPELLNRFDAVVAYTPLSDETVNQIIEIKLNTLNERLLKKYNKSVPISSELIESIKKSGLKEEFGARDIDRAIKRVVEDKVADEVLS